MTVRMVTMTILVMMTAMNDLNPQFRLLCFSKVLKLFMVFAPSKMVSWTKSNDQVRKWNGMKRNGMEWNGKEQNGIEW
jgi:hypothetical protein